MSELGFHFLQIRIVYAYNPVIDDYPGIYPPQTVVEEENHTPFTFPVEELLSLHFGIEVAAEQEKIFAKRYVQYRFAIVGPGDFQTGSRAGGESRGGEFGIGDADGRLVLFTASDEFLA